MIGQRTLAVVCSCFMILCIPEEIGARIFPLAGFKYLRPPFSWPRWVLAVTMFIGLSGYVRTLWIIQQTIGRDMKLIYRILFRVMGPLLRAKMKNLTVAQMFEETVQRNPDKTMITFVNRPNPSEKLSFAEVDSLANQTGNYFRSQSLCQGDVVAVMLENRVDHTGTWLGLTKIGVISAMVNINIKGNPLLHSIDITNAKGILFSDETESALESIVDQLDPNIKLFKLSTKAPKNELLKTNCHLVYGAIRRCSDTRPSECSMLVKFTDPLMYVFTSGTTGLPKAATVSHSRYMLTGHALYGMCAMDRDKDVLYTMLPMYHTSANGLCTGAVIMSGMSMVCRAKFSASQYWSDCVDNGVTVAQYIGEVARYLINTPKSASESHQKVRMLFGNGMRADIFDEIRQRFNVDICEFYGATEGNCNLINFMNKKGAVGFVSRLFPFLLPYRVFKVDPETGDFVRDPRTGLCVECESGEVGELVSPIAKGNPVRDFDGYLDRKATSQKVAGDVFNHGDHCFRSGDLMVMDDLGYLYFVDRAGDTFRWKGENVSTMEVESILSRILGYKDLNVYGVQVTGTEGRACMLAVVMGPGQQLDLADLFVKVEQHLPAYARPVFVRFLSRMEMTSTYKFRKINLMKAGFDVRSLQDPIFYQDSDRRTYTRLTPDIYTAIQNQQHKL